MAGPLIASIELSRPVSATTVTTDPMNTTGATLLIVTMHGHSISSSNAFTVVDSKSNSWTMLTQYGVASDTRVRMAYCIAPGSVGTLHTVTVAASGGTIYPNVTFAAFGNGSYAYDSVENGAATASSVTSLNTGNITPAGNGRLVVTALTANGFAGDANPGSSFFIYSNAVFNNSLALKGCAAYVVQATAAAIQGAWSWSPGVAASATVAAFQYTASAGGSSEHSSVF